MLIAVLSDCWWASLHAKCLEPWGQSPFELQPVREQGMGWCHCEEGNLMGQGWNDENKICYPHRLYTKNWTNPLWRHPQVFIRVRLKPLVSCYRIALNQQPLHFHIEDLIFFFFFFFLQFPYWQLCLTLGHTSSALMPYPQHWWWMCWPVPFWAIPLFCCLSKKTNTHTTPHILHKPHHHCRMSFV